MSLFLKCSVDVTHVQYTLKTVLKTMMKRKKRVRTMMRKKKLKRRLLLLLQSNLCV
jgi:hypothetical protein